MTSSFIATLACALVFVETFEAQSLNGKSGHSSCIFCSVKYVYNSLFSWLGIIEDTFIWLICLRQAPVHDTKQKKTSAEEEEKKTSRALNEHGLCRNDVQSAC